MGFIWLTLHCLVFLSFTFPLCVVLFLIIVYVSYSNRAFWSPNAQISARPSLALRFFQFLFSSERFSLFFSVFSESKCVWQRNTEKKKHRMYVVSLGIIGKDVLQSLFVLNLHVSSRGITTGFRKHEFSGRLSSLLSLLLVFLFLFFFLFFLPVVLFSFLFFTNAWTFRPWRWRSGRRPWPWHRKPSPSSSWTPG